MVRKKTNEEFVNEVYELVGNEYKVLSEYQGSKSKIRFYHNVCNNDFLMSPNSFLRGQRCPNCSGVMKKTTEQFKEEVYNLVGDEYSVLGEYKNSKTKIKIKHNVCNNVYEVTPNSILRGTKCSYCYLTNRKTNQEFKREVYNLVGDEYTFLDDYVNRRVKLRVKHNVCGRVYKVNPYKFLQGDRCAKCSGKLQKTTQQFKEEVYSLVGNEYTVLGEYKNNHTKILIKHNVCKYKYRVTPSAFINSNRCPKCVSNYHNEDTIAKYLDQHKIKYNQHKHFDWLNYEGAQHLDFYLPDYNLAIEYDGEQHYQIVRHSKHETNQDLVDKLKLTQLRDKNKDKLCYQHNIKLIRIPYWKKDSIEKILDKELTN